MRKLLLLFVLVISLVYLANSEANAQAADSSKYSYASYSLMSIYLPDDDNLALKITGSSNKNLKFVKIFDIIGKEIASFDVSSSVNTLLYNIDISGNRQNLFICNLYSDKGIIESKKFFRNKPF